VLPVLGGAVAEVDAAAEGFDGMDGAEVGELEGAPATVFSGGELREREGGEIGSNGRELGEGKGGLESGDVEAVSGLLEVAATA